MIVHGQGSDFDVVHYWVHPAWLQVRAQCDFEFANAVSFKHLKMDVIVEVRELQSC